MTSPNGGQRSCIIKLAKNDYERMRRMLKECLLVFPEIKRKSIQILLFKKYLYQLIGLKNEKRNCEKG